MTMWQEAALVFAPFILPLILMGLGHDMGSLENDKEGEK